MYATKPAGQDSSNENLALPTAESNRELLLGTTVACNAFAKIWQVVRIPRLDLTFASLKLGTLIAVPASVPKKHPELTSHKYTVSLE